MDVGDGDTGANNLQNYPVITNTFTNVVVGSINSTPNTVLIIDVYDSPATDISAFGEGEVYRTSTTVTTDASGNATFSISATFVPGRFVSMTATDPAGSTSEFARSEVVRNVMPVTLMLFEAKVVSNQARLTWMTTEELNNDRFEIERAAEALNWLKIGSVKGFGSTNVTNTYQFIDDSPEIGTSYYRLKQVDSDGRFTYSPIKALNFEENFSERLTAYPNPTANGSVIIVLDQILDASAATVLNITGAKLNNTPLRNLTPNKITIDLSAQPPGVYLVNINGKTVKVLKQ